MTRQDWWLGVVLIVSALFHAVFPRYEWRGAGLPFRVDRWTGTVTSGDGMRWDYRPAAPLTIEKYEPLPKH